jgi:recombination protein RecR
LNTYPSQLLEKAVNELSRLPGIGRKSALRMALHLLKCKPEEVEAFGHAVISLRNSVIYCSSCGNISDSEVCAICASPKRDHGLVCVVEDIRDVMAIEGTGQFNGIYHVLGGIISPIDGIGPQDLNINNLVEKVVRGGISEVILALPTTIEGDTTNFYLFKKMAPSGVKVTMIARGISIGDEVTLGRSILNRQLYPGK